MMTVIDLLFVVFLAFLATLAIILKIYESGGSANVCDPKLRFRLFLLLRYWWKKNTFGKFINCKLYAAEGISYEYYSYKIAPRAIDFAIPFSDRDLMAAIAEYVFDRYGSKTTSKIIWSFAKRVGQPKPPNDQFVFSIIMLTDKTCRNFGIYHALAGSPFKLYVTNMFLPRKYINLSLVDDMPDNL